jgi:transcriptional regulator GlxA family with amidase domain
MPAAVFGNAHEVVGKNAYRVSTVAMNAGPVGSSGGIVVLAEGVADFVSPGTVFVVGAEAEPLGMALRNKNLLGWLSKYAAAGMRMGSVCTGAFLLARAGLLERRRATTHWAARQDLSRLDRPPTSKATRCLSRMTTSGRQPALPQASTWHLPLWPATSGRP